MTGPRPELFEPPAQDVRAVARVCAARILEREGIPMFVALHDARPGRTLTVSDPLAKAEGVMLAGLLGQYVDALAAAPPEVQVESARVAGAAAGLEPSGAQAQLIEALVVLSDQHLRARP